MRPYPAAAEGLTVRQIGDQIRLEWHAPTRNTDNTTDKLELAEVEVRRRIVDLPALVEAQTEIIEPEPEEEEEPVSEQTPGETETVEPGELEPEPGAPEPLEDATPSGPEDPDAVAIDETGPIEEEAAAEPEAPPTPILEIGQFAPDSRYVTTLESTEPGGVVTFEETVDPAWIGLRIQYAVVYTNRSHRRGPRSTSVSIDPASALPAPERPATETGDGFVTVRWNEPAPESYYSIFRRPQDADELPDTPLNGVPIAETEYVDRSVTFDAGWCYAIRTVPEPPPPPALEATSLESDNAPDEEPAPEPEPEMPEPQAPGEPTILVPEIPPIQNPVRVESVASPEVCLVPVDTIGPPPPTGLVAVRSGNNVLLTWAEVDRPDVVGYRVYRGLAADGPFEPLTDEVVRAPSYTDATAESGVTYFYVVTSVDDAPAANESRHSELSELILRP